ncbi:MAG: hypothetical protein QXZ31_05700 [Thermofilaceae archaeon]
MYVVNPREVEEELARIFAPPVQKIVRHVALPRYAGAYELLYGVPIFVIGEGVVGQYVRHSFFDVEGVRYWRIEYGVVNIYGVLNSKKYPKGMAVPLVMLGLPTYYARQLTLEDFEDFTLEEVVTGYIDVEERRILNLDRVSRGIDPIMLLDVHGVFSTTASNPSELIEKIVEASRQIEVLQRAVWEYEKNYRVMETNLRIAQSEVASLRAVIQELNSLLEKLASENTRIYTELVKLREELKVRSTEVLSGQDTADSLVALVNRTVELVGEVARSASKALDEARAAYEKAVELGRAAGAAAGVAAAREEKEGGEESEEA